MKAEPAGRGRTRAGTTVGARPRPKGLAHPAAGVRVRERERSHGRGHASHYVMIGMINSATMFATLIIGLIAGPAVSL